MNGKKKLNTIYGIYGMYVDAKRVARLRESVPKMIVDKFFIYCDTDSVKPESELVNRNKDINI